MKDRFRLIYRGERGATFYSVDSETGKRTSLQTKDRDAAKQIVFAKNQAVKQPSINLQLAKAYLAGSDSGVATRTWQIALNTLVETKDGSTKERWLRAAKDKALDGIREQVIIETTAENLLQALKQGTVSTNIHLRKLHNFCIAMNWPPWPLIPKRLWPEIKFKDKRAITIIEHSLIIEREKNPERKSFYELCWHLGGSQSDVAHLTAEDIDWQNQTIAYARKKTGSLAIVHFGDEIAEILRRLPTADALFPYLRRVRSGDRATEFKQRCEGLGISGVTLHSYRYAWAERARKCGYPERFAQEALGHNSKAVHRSYAKRAQVRLPSLEKYERSSHEENVIPISIQTGTAPVWVVESAQGR
jgi:integrase